MVNNFIPMLDELELIYSHNISTIDYNNKYNLHKTSIRIYNYGLTSCNKYIITTENPPWLLNTTTDFRLLDTKCFITTNPIGMKISPTEMIKVFICNGIINQKNNYIIYTKNGLVHRENGPAIIKHLSNTKEYYINGENYMPQEYWEKIKDTLNADIMFSELFGIEE